MSLRSIFSDALRKAKGKEPKGDVDVKSLGTMGSVPEAYKGSFDPLRPTPEPDAGKGIDHGDVAPAGTTEVASADPEEGGEATPTSDPSAGKVIDRGDVSPGGNPGIASGDPEEGGEVTRP
jgi:hypothetical protein